MTKVCTELNGIPAWIVVEINKFKVGLTGHKFNLENMKKYDITEKFISIVKIINY